jgi:ADP-ribose pyrophosphatase YjhB (NUDIX family)
MTTSTTNSRCSTPTTSAPAATCSAPPPTAVVRVGVGVLVKCPDDPSKVLCGVRRGSHGAGSLALPGGHLEMMESFEDCAVREVWEECALRLDTPTFGHVTNDPMPREGKHYVTVFMMARYRRTIPYKFPRTWNPASAKDGTPTAGTS